MKKLLVLALMLGLTTVASASIFINGPQEIRVNVSDLVTIQIGNSPKPDGIGDIGLLSIDAGAGIFTGQNVWHGEFAQTGAPGFIIQEPLLVGFDSSAPNFTRTSAGILAEIQFHCEGFGDVWISLMDGNTGEIIGTLLIRQDGIPEPATIAMLGLGGLALLRRRK